MTVATNKPFMMVLAKTLLLAIPLIVAYMFGVYWCFSWLSHEHGLSLPRWLLPLITLLGIYFIVVKMLGADLMQMKRDHDVKEGKAAPPNNLDP